MWTGCRVFLMTYKLFSFPFGHLVRNGVRDTYEEMSTYSFFDVKYTLFVLKILSQIFFFRCEECIFLEEKTSNEWDVQNKSYCNFWNEKSVNYIYTSHLAEPFEKKKIKLMLTNKLYNNSSMNWMRLKKRNVCLWLHEIHDEGS